MPYNRVIVKLKLPADLAAPTILVITFCLGIEALVNHIGHPEQFIFLQLSRQRIT